MILNDIDKKKILLKIANSNRLLLSYRKNRGALGSAVKGKVIKAISDHPLWDYVSCGL